MTPKHPFCVRLEPDLVATATGEAEPAVAARVQEHVALCPPCHDELGHYRAVDAVLAGLRDAPAASAAEASARAALVQRLADLRRRLVFYRVFPSPLGNILIARTEEGIGLVEYLGAATDLSASRLARADAFEAREDGAELTTVHQELMDYLGGRRTRLDWPLDLALARGSFDRKVLELTAAIPYGAVTSYAALARELGKPTAARAVAQALRWNPLPIVIPCHRIVGSSGDLTGYAGDKLSLKEQLLSVEGVRVRAGDSSRSAPTIAREAMYTCTRGDTEYCLPTCGSLPERTLADLVLFGSRERAEATGLRPCTSCRPDLYPLSAA